MTMMRETWLWTRYSELQILDLATHPKQFPTVGIVVRQSAQTGRHPGHPGQQLRDPTGCTAALVLHLCCSATPGTLVSVTVGNDPNHLLLPNVT